MGEMAKCHKRGAVAVGKDEWTICRGFRAGRACGLTRSKK